MANEHKKFENYNHFGVDVMVKWTAIASQAWTGPQGCRRLRLPIISRQSGHEGGKVIIPTHRPPLPHPNPQKIPLVIISVRGRKEKSTKNPSDPIGNRGLDLPAYIAMPYPNAPPPATHIMVIN